MNVLIAKLGATGDVVRTTTLLHRLTGQVTWLTASKNTALFEGGMDNVRCFSWEQRDQAADRSYDLIINLEDTIEVGQFLQTLEAKRFYGAYLNGADHLCYTEDSHRWFDLSLISSYGKEEADRLKLKNRESYQSLIFSGLDYRFEGEKYVLPKPMETGLKGDVAISPEAGPVWPMKNWAYYNELKAKLEGVGLKVNVLPRRSSLLEHLGDVAGHRCLVSGDSLPMHLALGSGTRCVTLFTCTSPWEIFGYGLQKQIISPLLGEFFYKRDFDVRATTTIALKEVLAAVMEALEGTDGAASGRPPDAAGSERVP